MESDSANLSPNLTEELQEKSSCTAYFTYKGYPVNVVSTTQLVIILLRPWRIWMIVRRSLASTYVQFTVAKIDPCVVVKLSVTSWYVMKQPFLMVLKAKLGSWLLLFVPLIAVGFEWSDRTTTALTKVNTVSSSGRQHLRFVIFANRLHP